MLDHPSIPIKNPLRVIGVSREIATNSSPEQLLAVAGKLRQLLLTQHHPDRQGEQPSSQSETSRIRREEIRQAWNLLQNPENLERARKLYKPITPQQELIQARRVASNAQAEYAAQRKHSARVITELHLKNERTVHNTAPCSILLYDYGRAQREDPLFNPSSPLNLSSTQKDSRLERIRQDYGNDPAVDELEGRSSAGNFVKVLNIGQGGSLPETPERRLVATLRIDLKEHSPEDFLKALSDAGLALPSASRMLQASTDTPRAPDSSSTLGGGFRTDHIRKEELARLTEFISGRLTTSGPDELVFLVSGTVPQDKDGDYIFHIEGLIEEITDQASAQKPNRPGRSRESS